MGGLLDDLPDQRLRELRITTAMQGIVNYLRLHPDSADSVRGVQLWLSLLADELSEEIIGLALERLVAGGKLEAKSVPGGTVVYGRGRRWRN
jgi:hypothetical protein